MTLLGFKENEDQTWKKTAAFGITTMFLAGALHFRYFWGLSEKPTLKRYSLVGKVVSLVGAMVGLLYMTWCMLRLFIL